MKQDLQYTAFPLYILAAHLNLCTAFVRRWLGAEIALPQRTHLVPSRAALYFDCTNTNSVTLQLRFAAPTFLLRKSDRDGLNPFLFPAIGGVEHGSHNVVDGRQRNLLSHPRMVEVVLQ